MYVQGGKGIVMIVLKKYWCISEEKKGERVLKGKKMGSMENGENKKWNIWIWGNESWLPRV